MKSTRTHRLIRIIQILQAGQRRDVNSLSEELGGSRRTIFRDMSALKNTGLVFKYDAVTESYQVDHSCFLKPLTLALDEALAIMLLTRKVVNARVVPFVASAISAGLKLESMLPFDLRNHCGRLLDGVEVDWPKMSDVDGVADVMMAIEQAIASRKKLHMQYESLAEKSEIDTILRPYRVFFRSRGWYVVGYSERHQEVRMFKLERLVELTPLADSFKPDPDFSLQRYFGSAWDVIRGDQRYHVEIHFSSKVAGNVEEVAWHTTQRTRRLSDGSLVFEVDVDGIEEISWWIMGYGDQAVVTEPEMLRLLIQSHAKNLLRYYENKEEAPVARN